MTERDEEGRPIATRNAGAFLGPFSGVVPVPSDLAADGQTIEPDLGPRLRWQLAGGDAIAVWALGFGVLQLLLSGTADRAGTSGGYLGEQLTAAMHTPLFLVLAHAALFALAWWMGSRRLRPHGRSDRLRLVAVTLAGAIVVSALVWLIGALAAAIGIAVALVWLLGANRVRPA